MPVSGTTEKRIYVPEVARDIVESLAQRIKPLVRFDDELRYIEPMNIDTSAFTWSPEPAEIATGIVPVRDITTYHSYAYYGFFKPTIKEVLTHIPVELRESVVAFEIVERPQDAADLNREHEALNAGFHVATTRLYVASPSTEG